MERHENPEFDFESALGAPWRVPLMKHKSNSFTERQCSREGFPYRIEIKLNCRTPVLERHENLKFDSESALGAPGRVSRIKRK